MTSSPERLSLLETGGSTSSQAAVEPSARRRPWKTVAAGLATFAAVSGVVRVSSSASSSPQSLGSTELLARVMSEKVTYAELSADDTRALWTQWKMQHGRDAAASAAADQVRFEVFSANLKYMDKLNMQNPHALFGPTSFADRTSEEIATRRAPAHYASWERMKASVPSDVAASGVERLAEFASAAVGFVGDTNKTWGGPNADDDLPESQTEIGGEEMKKGQVKWVSYNDCAACKSHVKFANYTVKNTPRDFDWRALDAVSDVKNQYACESDWAMAAVADMEGTHYLATGSMDDISVQQLIACDPTNDGCDGGFTFQAFQYAEQFGGIVLDKDYGYKGVCAEDDCADDSASDATFDSPMALGGGTQAHDTPICEKKMVNEAMKRGESVPVGGWQMVAMGAEYETELMKVAMLRNGPLAAVMNAEGMEHYVHGVTGCPKDGDCEAGEVDHHEQCDPTYLDHSVLIVGYGKDEGMAYWTVKNTCVGLSARGASRIAYRISRIHVVRIHVVSICESDCADARAFTVDRESETGEGRGTGWSASPSRGCLSNRERWRERRLGAAGGEARRASCHDSARLRGRVSCLVMGRCNFRRRTRSSVTLARPSGMCARAPWPRTSMVTLTGGARSGARTAITASCAASTTAASPTL